MSKKVKNVVMNIIFVLVLIAIDQVAKYVVRTELINGKELIIWEDVFKVIFHMNTGAVWGMLQGATIILSVFSVLILAAVIFFYCKLPQDDRRYLPLGIISLFIMAGAIGNLIDRVLLGYVVDFLYFELIDFPVFNIADCYITLSMILVLILFLFKYKEDDFKFLSFKKKKEISEEN